MSELKKPSVLQLRHNNSEGFVYAYEVDEMNKYLSEADKVIAEKDAEIAELKEQVHDYGQGLYVMQARDEKEACHQKYKRCLAMAEACRHKRWRGGIGEEGYDYARATRHMNVWLELAEKFKEAK